MADRVRMGLESLCREEGTTLVVTSHNMTDVERICERVVFLDADRVVADGFFGVPVAADLAAGAGVEEAEQLGAALVVEAFIRCAPTQGRR